MDAVTNCLGALQGWGSGQEEERCASQAVARPFTHCTGFNASPCPMAELGGRVGETREVSSDPFMPALLAVACIVQF